MTDRHTHHKALLEPLRAALYDFDEASARRALQAVAPDALFRHCHPFGDIQGADGFFDAAFAPLARAWPDAEYVIVPDAGHSAMEPGIRSALVKAMDGFR